MSARPALNADATAPAAKAGDDAPTIGRPPNLDFVVPGGALRGALAAAWFTSLQCDGAAPETGSRLGPYTVDRRIGSGGTAIIHAASVAGAGPGARVAIKLARATGITTVALRHEQKVLARLRHPRIVRLLDSGETGDGRPWLALDFVDGSSLLRHCRERNPDARQRIGLLLGIAGALRHAHGRGVVHGDLKPGNVLVDRNGLVRLIDFGCATHDAAAAAGHRAFTPGWASPEQVAGVVPTAASDIFQLGRLAGRLLLRGESSRLLPPRQRRDAAAIVAMATRRRPTARHPHMAALEEALAGLRGAPPARLRTGSPPFPDDFGR